METQNFTFKDLLFFDKMLVPIIVKYLYWISLVLSLVFAIIMCFDSFLSGILFFISSVIASRVFYELVIVVFKVFEKLTIIADKMDDIESAEETSAEK